MRLCAAVRRRGGWHSRPQSLWVLSAFALPQPDFHRTVPRGDVVESEAKPGEQVVVEGATMSWGGLLFRDPMLSWMNVVKYTTRNKFLDFGGLNSKIDDSMARKPIGLLLDYFFVTYTTLTIARDPRR